jgi:hypothetical protein
LTSAKVVVFLGMLKINQNGVRPGPRKLEQFKQAFKLTNTPALYANEDVEDPIVTVKLFDPTGSATWYLTEFSEVAPDGVPNLAFGLCDLFQDGGELGYVSIEELATVKGRLGIGIEIDVHWEPKPLSQVRGQ